ncbi:hypothetical protein BDK51DRAFT_33235 [Blyttiomyces helicus]|uniref:Uncharacterized protein n=1 Tax=Blyttiomyces helicus TaxID=388810 RepID=A0A4P9W1L8_9FUNG|nr:hypothetical protein BDK51DRAFT_33235 [Blyttiomyces helicus]|eukprot:RKO83966.1 hypothetical protein BDK51DRAFT_33235 [Blyttiomyces helicus]
MHLRARRLAVPVFPVECSGFQLWKWIKYSSHRVRCKDANQRQPRYKSLATLLLPETAQKSLQTKQGVRFPALNRSITLFSSSLSSSKCDWVLLAGGGRGIDESLPTLRRRSRRSRLSANITGIEWRFICPSPLSNSYAPAPVLPRGHLWTRVANARWSIPEVESQVETTSCGSRNTEELACGRAGFAWKRLGRWLRMAKPSALCSLNSRSGPPPKKNPPPPLQKTDTISKPSTGQTAKLEVVQWLSAIGNTIMEAEATEMPQRRTFFYKRDVGGPFLF